VQVEERLHLLVGDVDTQLLVRVDGEILEAENVQNTDRTAFTAAKNKQNISYK